MAKRQTKQQQTKQTKQELAELLEWRSELWGGWQTLTVLPHLGAREAYLDIPGSRDILRRLPRGCSPHHPGDAPGGWIMGDRGVTPRLPRSARINAAPLTHKLPLSEMLA